MNSLINYNNSSRNFTTLKRNAISFKSDKNQTVTISHNPKNINNLLDLNNQFLSVTKEIGGLKEYNGISDGIILAKGRIDELSRETQKAWGFNPKVLQEKLNALKGLSNQLDAIEELFNQNGNDIKGEKKGLILPEKPSILIDPMEVSAIYNKSIKGQPLSKKSFGPSNFTTTEELRSALSPIEQDDWDYRKLNYRDSQMYKKLKGQLIVGENKKIITDQINTIDVHLTKLKKEGFEYSPDTHLNVYDHRTTGKILALETAKLRRTTLFDSIIRPEYDKNLERPDILLQPTPDNAPMVFKMDAQFAPKKYEVFEALEKNSGFKPIIKNLFPKGLPLYIVPGYLDEKMEDLNGGESIPGHPDEGVWVNSYNVDKKYDYTIGTETFMAKARGVEPFKPSVLKGNLNRARTIAHEIGHVVSYKVMNNDAMTMSKEGKQSLFTLSPEVGFMDGWSGLRVNSKSKLNGDEMNARSNRGMDSYDKKNLEKCIDYESIAEDIRMAATGDVLPASSKMTGVYDQSKEGQKDFKKVMHYVKQYFFKNKKPTEIIGELMKDFK